MKKLTTHILKISLIGVFLSQLIFGQNHFSVVNPTGLAYHIVLEDLTINGKAAPQGTEIGIFDGDLCVGSAMLYNELNSSIDIVTWQGNSSY
ncbi:MAG: hypothetical protein DRP96_12825, partial [Candidatus Neomarinimicrobiota bacterium]